jgi:hypothetical protein
MPADSKSLLKAGIAQVDITPPIGIEMGGFSARVQPSIGIYDPLFVKVLLLDDGHDPVGIVSCDLMGFSNAYDAALREAIAKTGIVKSDRLMIACSHNHAGPATHFLRNCGNVDEKWMAALRGKIVKAVKQAAQNLRSVTVEYSQGRAALNYDRRAWLNGAATESKRWERDTRVSVVQFKAGLETVVNLLHYSCHPVTMLGENSLLSAEYCGQACSYLEEQTGAPTLFLNGACGNVNPLLTDGAGKQHMVSDFPERSYEHVVRMGQRLGQIAMASLKRSRRLSALPLRAEMKRLDVPLQIPSASEIESALQCHKAKLQDAQLSTADRWLHSTFLDWAQKAKVEMEAGRIAKSTPVSVQSLSVGELTLVGVGGELFAAIGKRIQKLVGPPCLIVGFANGNVGYLPTRKAFSQGGYEVEEAGKLYGLFGVGPQAEEVILNGVLRMQPA